ncbi:hypothetical protein ACFL6S_04365 [Candidatus Poribacteria bacterium]
MRLAITLLLTLSATSLIGQEHGGKAMSDNVPILEYVERDDRGLVNIKVPAIEGMECEIWCYEQGNMHTAIEHHMENAGVLVLIHRDGNATVTSRFVPSAGAVDIHVTVTGPTEEDVRSVRNLNACWQFEKSPTFSSKDRAKYVEDFVARCFVILDGGLTLLKGTKRIPGTRGQENDKADLPNPWIQEYYPIWRTHPGQTKGQRGRSPDLPVYPIIGCTSRDGKHLAAIAWPETGSLGQVWHHCVHPRPWIVESYDEASNETRSRARIYFMENDGEKLISAFKEDFPDWVRPDLERIEKE